MPVAEVGKGGGEGKGGGSEDERAHAPENTDERDGAWGLRMERE